MEDNYTSIPSEIVGSTIELRKMRPFHEILVNLSFTIFMDRIFKEAPYAEESEPAGSTAITSCKVELQIAFRWTHTIHHFKVITR